MIGKLKGIVDSCGEDWLIVDVGGVGYQVFCSIKTRAALPPVGEPVALAIETLVRETEIRLFGFADDHEREWFRLLMTVQGVGARVALAVLSTSSPSELASAVALGDKAMVARAPGVGPKVAARIVTELKDKAPALAGALPGAGGAPGFSIPAGASGAPAVGDAISALTNLGYGQGQAAAAVAAALRDLGGEAEAGALIRAGLKELSSA